MAKSKFTEADVERACSGARKAGIEVASVEMRPDGSILVTAALIKNALADDPGELRRLM